MAEGAACTGPLRPACRGLAAEGKPQGSAAPWQQVAPSADGAGCAPLLRRCMAGNGAYGLQTCRPHKLSPSLLSQFLQTSGKPWSWQRGPARGGRPVRSVQLLQKLLLWLPTGTLRPPMLPPTSCEKTCRCHIHLQSACLLPCNLTMCSLDMWAMYARPYALKVLQAPAGPGRCYRGAAPASGKNSGGVSTSKLARSLPPRYSP